MLRRESMQITVSEVILVYTQTINNIFKIMNLPCDHLSFKKKKKINTSLLYQLSKFNEIAEFISDLNYAS
jgi:hypothetical protein